MHLFPEYLSSIFSQNSVPLERWLTSVGCKRWDREDMDPECRAWREGILCGWSRGGEHGVGRLDRWWGGYKKWWRLEMWVINIWAVFLMATLSGWCADMLHNLVTERESLS